MEESGAANGGILIDMMHWHQQDGGPNFGLLEQIPGEHIHYVQVCDTVPPRAPAGDYMQEAPGNRAARARVASHGPETMARQLAACPIG